MELKPCRSCNGPDVHYFPHNSDFNVYETHNIECEDCGYSMEGYKSKGAVIKAWNHRPIEDALRGRIENLEKLLNDALFQIGIVGPKLAEREERIYHLTGEWE